MSTLRESRLWSYLTLTRPANLITAVADILAGFAVGAVLVGQENIWQILDVHGKEVFALAIATIGLYGGGVVFNDVFDLELDKIERPERPIPSGKVSKSQATSLGIVLLIGGIAAAFFVGKVSGILAILIAALALLYDAKSKHYVFWGPINMAACRGGNLLLGVSAFESALIEAAALALFPLIFIASITLISQGEVSGGNKLHLKLAVMGYSLVLVLLSLLGIVYPFEIVFALPFMALFAFLVLPPLFKAYKTEEALDIRKAVKAGVICLIVLNASIAAGFAGILYGLMILVLLPISMGLGKLFSVS